MQIIQEPGDPAHIGLVLSQHEYEILVAALGYIPTKDVYNGILSSRKVEPHEVDESFMRRTITNMYTPMSDLLEERGLWK
jgi:hypothetical protein